MASLRICDEKLPGTGGTEQPELSGLPDVITVEELIRWRVREEVARYNANANGKFNGLIEPLTKERELNADGGQKSLRQPIKWEEQAETAVRGFERNAFFVMVDGQQACNLSDYIDVLKATEATFIKLVPLVGG
ncbi:hypothetical protein [Paenarthrobacter aurescens]|uniref:Uncharacterized protein n=1 Tax=Paenarthrobacter aurescens TaxID=43663 RepID=A0A4Y3NIP5_PAEAU|nr:hypothetical protein [Paenarthrobacter aurescens]MDO6142285.1 hypothetical protein [Paenarthrobacter aurescens]MDO6146132.1 hypothetical protein [Paenarthrobacter aurescens]MDO6157377.1 hypothetical protein [Paenarthrobacter aurescens]MDO6161362.1 hypothetical protein [Paenarthrobacter aurescens]GEB18996.1 hypothetical protein AAU01_17510 [Paenarthrobacter aurescens]